MVRAFAGRATVDTYASFLDHRRRPVRAQIVRRVRRSARTVSADGGGSGWRRYGYSARALVLVWAPDPPIALLGLVGVTALTDARLPLGWLRFLAAMAPVTIVITGASGNLGRLTAAAVAERVPPSELILVTRTPEKLAAFARSGATVRPGDFAQPDSLPGAFAGGTRALIISTIGGSEAAARHAAAFQAAAETGVQHIVYTSVPNPVVDNPFPPVAVHRASEQALRGSGVAFTVLRNALYADLRADLAAKYIQHGRWTTNIGEGCHAFIARRDCAAAAAGALTGHGHEGQTYEITGPELVGRPQFLGLLEEASGRPVACIQYDDREYEAYRSAFMSDPGNARFFELFTGTGRAIRMGFLNQLTGAVRHLSGQAPLTLREVIAQRRDTAGTAS